MGFVLYNPTGGFEWDLTDHHNNMLITIYFCLHCIFAYIIIGVNYAVITWWVSDFCSWIFHSLVHDHQVPTILKENTWKVPSSYCHSSVDFLIQITRQEDPILWSVRAKLWLQGSVFAIFLSRVFHLVITSPWAL